MCGIFIVVLFIVQEINLNLLTLLFNNKPGNCIRQTRSVKPRYSFYQFGFYAIFLNTDRLELIKYVINYCAIYCLCETLLMNDRFFFSKW